MGGAGVVGTGIQILLIVKFEAAGAVCLVLLSRLRPKFILGFKLMRLETWLLLPLITVPDSENK